MIGTLRQAVPPDVQDLCRMLGAITWTSSVIATLRQAVALDVQDLCRMCWHNYMDTISDRYMITGRTT